MAKRPSAPREDPAKVWDGRLRREDKRYTEWSDRFECSRLDDYYEGRQWKGIAEEAAKKKYVINLTFASVETQLPTLLFSQPKVQVEARPDHQETAGSDASGRATLIEHTLQTFIDDPKVHFGFETTLALRDAYSRYAVVKVGYSADWIDNPNAGKPLLKDDGSTMMDEGDPVMEPERMLRPETKESIYVRRLDPACVRVSPGRNLLQSNDWVAYYEWHPIEDVKANPRYRNTRDLKSSHSLKGAGEEAERETDDTWQRAGQVKLWTIYDLRGKVRHVHAESHTKLLLQNEPCPVLPIAVLKFFERRNSFYPVPPIYNWLHPQDEINEGREMQKIHRRRAKRFFMREAGVSVTEWEKVEAGEDMTCIEVAKTNPAPIVPIQDAPLDGNIWRDLATAHDDFSQITGVSGEARGVPEATTATQANIVNVRAGIRESRARNQVADWLGEIARLMLLTLRDSMKLPFMVQRHVDPFSAAQDPQDVARTAGAWQEIENEDIDGLDVDVSIDVASLSPVAEDASRAAWTQVLALLTNPPLLLLLMTPNPQAPNEPSALLRKTLHLYGVTSDQEVREIHRVGQLVLLQQQAMAMMGATDQGGMGMPGGGRTTGSPSGIPAVGVQ